MTLLRALPFITALLATYSSAPSRADLRDRPVVIVVHGRGQLGRDSAEVRRNALHALQEGSQSLVQQRLLTDDDVKLVWYADVLDARSRAAAAPCTRDDSLDTDSTPSSEPN